MPPWKQQKPNNTSSLGTRRIGLWMILLLMSLLIALEWPVESAAAQESCGILAYEWDEPVTESDRGFPRQQPPINNFDWTQPVDYAHGTLYYRVEIKRQPEPQDMRLQLCFWQPESANATYKFGLENCGPPQSIMGEAENVATWSRDVQDMWKLKGNLIDWTRSRFRAGVAVKNSAGEPVSNYNGWEWNGEDPKKWYPLVMHFTAVVVPKDGQFCGWNYYLNPTAVSLQDITADDSFNFTILQILIILVLITLLVWKIRPNNQ